MAVFDKMEPLVSCTVLSKPAGSDLGSFFLIFVMIFFMIFSLKILIFSMKILDFLYRKS